MSEKDLTAPVDNTAEVEVTAAATPKKGLPTKKKKWTRQAVGGLCLALIPLVGFLIFSGFPIIISFISLFSDVNLTYIEDGFTWNNFEGFKIIFIRDYAKYQTDIAYDIAGYFYKACGITLWLASMQFVTLAIALVISVLLATHPRGGKVFQILYFIPYICSTVAVSLMWKWFFNGEPSGVLNSILGTEIRWLENTSTMTWTIVVAIIWQAPGYGIVMYKAALANVDTTQYEAAALDGANAWQKFWHITVPGIAPTTFFLMISGVSAGLLTYDIAALMIPDGWNYFTEGGMGLTLMRLAYYLRGVGKNVSSSAVISWVLFAVTAGISYVLFKRREKSMEG